MGLRDGIPSFEVNSTTLSGGTVIVDTLTAGNSQISSAEIGSGGVLSANISGAQVLSSHIASGNVLTAQISGAQVNSTHIASGAILSAQISGAQVLSSHIASGAVLTAQISGGQVNNTHIVANTIRASEHRIIGTGSPSVFGRSVQMGEFVTGGGSNTWVVFGTGFTAAPLVVVSQGPANAGWVRYSTLQAGSFLAESENANTSGSWLATGSGNI